MQDAQQSDAAQQVPPVLAMLPAQQQQPSLPESALSDVAAATLSSHVVDATGHQHTAEPAAGEGLLPKGLSPTTDQCASGADEPPAAVVGQPQHHTAGPEQSEAPATASTCLFIDTVPEHVVTAVLPASQPSTAGPGQSEASASAAAHAVSSAAAQQLAPDAPLPSTAISDQPSAEHAERCGDAAGSAGEHTASQVVATDGEQITGQQQSPGAQQPEQASQTVAQPVLAEVDTNSQNHTARLGKRPAPPPSHEPRLKQRKLNAAAEDEQEQLGGSEDPSPAGQHATRPMSAGEGKQGEQAVGRHVGEQGEAAAQAAPAVPSGSMPTGNSLPRAVCICCGSIVTGSSVSCQCMLAHRTRV